MDFCSTQCTYESRSRKHSCREGAIIISDFECMCLRVRACLCVCLALIIRQVTRLRRNILSSVTCLTLVHFFPFISQTALFGIKGTEQQMCF